MEPALPKVPYWQLARGRMGESVEGLEELAQAVSIVLGTPLRSVPLRPEFGADLLSWVDAPENQAIAGLAREALRAIRRWEPRVRVDSVRWRRTGPGQGSLILTWVPVGSDRRIHQRIAFGSPSDLPTWVPGGGTSVPGGTPVERTALYGESRFTSSGKIRLPKAYAMLRVTTESPSRVRLYANTDIRDTDASRIAGVDPTPNTGVLMDVVTTPAMLSVDLAPLPLGTGPDAWLVLEPATPTLLRYLILEA